MYLINYIIPLYMFLPCYFADFIPYDELYEAGIEAYSQERWEEAIDYFEQAISSHRRLENGVVVCYRKCRRQNRANPLLEKTDLGKIVLKAACTRECLDEEFGDTRWILRIGEDAKNSMNSLSAYPYLQFAHFQEKNLKKSVSSAFTYILRYPDDSMMKENMEYYESNGNVTVDMYFNMEPKKHLDKYDEAVQSYLREDYSEAVGLFEDALVEYYEEIERCQALCEGEYDLRDGKEDAQIDFERENADYYIKVMECNLKCLQESTSYTGVHVANYLPLHYHYLQFAYYQLNNFESAAECAKTFLVFYPNDQVVLKNLELFEKKINSEDVSPRKEAALFHKRIKIQAELLRYSYQNFGIHNYDKGLLEVYPEISEDPEPEDLGLASEDEEVENNNPGDVPADEEPYESMKEKTDDIIEMKDIENERIELIKEKRMRDEEHYKDPENDVDISSMLSEPAGRRAVDSKYLIRVDDKASSEEPLAEGPLLNTGTVLLANSTQLKGRNRFAVDGFSTDMECLEMIDLELSVGKPGDGYGGNPSPHTMHEKFEGVTVLRAAELAQEGIIPVHSALMYYDLSEKVRAQVQAYFRLPELYFDYTHLVCRTAVSESQGDRLDLSHPVHADNCIMEKNGDCVRDSPAYYWRDYSAILYLNREFDGGEFLFADSSGRRVKTLLTPRCGRMVSFSAGKECYHGVKPVIKGQRCAMALWFTLSRSRAEEGRKRAKDILSNLEKSDQGKDEL